jgi:hypothetical protein
MRFFICTDYLSDRPLIIAIDSIESIFYKTKQEYMNQWANYNVSEEDEKMFGEAPEICTVIQTKNSGSYNVRNSLEEIIEFIKGTNNG